MSAQHTLLAFGSRTIAACLLIVSVTCGGSKATTPTPSPAPAPTATCDPTLWNHVHDPSRLHILGACQTVTGVVAVGTHANNDGDIDMDIAVDPQFANLLNNGNITKLNGTLHVEAVCQAPVHPTVPDALRACRDFKGSVLIPPAGAYVQVTGTYVLDTGHGWMEIHPATVITVLR